MPETLPALLWRLSEGGEPANFLGRCDQPHEAGLFERLLERGVLRHAGKLTCWDVCAACDCGLDERAIRWLDGIPVAVCPVDRGHDTRLDPEDLISFRVCIPALVVQAALESGFPSPQEISAGVWRLGKMQDGRVLLLVPTRLAIAQPGLVSILHMTDPGSNIVLLGPALPEAERAALSRQGAYHLVLHQLAESSVQGRHLALDLTGVSRAVIHAPRLIVHTAALIVQLDGKRAELPSRPFQLLLLLAQRLHDGQPIVSTADIHAAIFSPGTAPSTIRALVAELRRQLNQVFKKLNLGSVLIETRTNLGYAIGLSSKEVQISP